MRGDAPRTEALFSYLSPAQRVPKDHPLREVRRIADAALQELSPAFSKMYSAIGRPSIPPEHLLRALLLQALYTVRSERLLMEQLDYNLLFRWFVGIGMDDAVWDATTFSKNRDRLLEADVAGLFFHAVLSQAKGLGLTSDEHFTVDGTLLEAWAGLKSFQRKDGKGPGPSDDDRGNPTVNFHGEKRRNDTHQSTTDPESRLARKGNGKEAKLSYQGHVVMENRNGLAVAGKVSQAGGRAEVESALELLDEMPRSKDTITVAGDKGYDTRAFVDGARSAGATPHVAQKSKYSAIDGRTTRHPGYSISQGKRKRVEEIFGWMKTVGLMRKTRHRGVERVNWMFTFVLAAYNLVRMRNLASANA
jgi:transposase